MSRPHIICHMVTSVDGKVTGDFLFRPECAAATEIYYGINRTRRSDGFICGRVTMEDSFTGGWYPKLDKYAPVQRYSGKKCDFMPECEAKRYAVAFDTHGRLGWRCNRIVDPDGDPGYDGARIIEVLSEQVDERYLAYLEALQIPYIFAGESSIDIGVALDKLAELFGIKILLLEGGSVINGAFLRADAVDELSLVVAPVVAGAESKPLFYNAIIADFEFTGAENKNGALVLNYKRKRG